MQSISTQPYKGTRDFYPEDMLVQNYIFDNMKKVCRLYGYEEYMGPMLESFDLYAAKSGEEIVNNELYSFKDRGDRAVAIRPEMTPTVARMVAARMQELPKPIRWYSIPNLWRYEKPQRGRLREHWQLNVDVFGINTNVAEKEIISLSIDIMNSFGATREMYQVKLNSRKLLDRLFDEVLELSPEQKHSTAKLIDKMRKISAEDFNMSLKDAGFSDEKLEALNNYLKDAAGTLEELAQTNTDAKDLLKLIDDLKDRADVVFDPSLMRGFDYYTGVVFEIFDLDPANNRSMFGGGRYDDLLSIFGREKIPAFGLGMGEVVIKDFLETHNILPALVSETKVMVTIFNEDLRETSEEIAAFLRSKNINTVVGEGKLDKQIKYADQKKINYALILGPEEVENGRIKLKDLFKREEQVVTLEDILENIK